MKHKSGSVNKSVFYQDIIKYSLLFDSWGHNTKHYFAFIQEKYFNTEEIENWIEDKQATKAKEKLPNYMRIGMKTVMKLCGVLLIIN